MTATPSTRAGVGGERRDNDNDDETDTPVPLQLINRYRQLTIDMNFELGDKGTCELQLESVHHQLARVRGGLVLGSDDRKDTQVCLHDGMQPCEQWDVL